MGKRSWMLVNLIALAALAPPLAGCNMGMPAGAQAPTEAPAAVKPLDAAAWPTPQPTAVVLSPTPFPKVTLAPTATRAPLPTATPRRGARSADASAPAARKPLSFTGNPQQLVQQVVELSGGFTPTGAAMVVNGTAEVRQGPGESYSAVGSAKMGEMAAVLG